MRGYIQSKAKEDRSFFVCIPYMHTHTPHDSHPDFKGKTRNDNFAAILAQTDSYAGKPLDSIEEAGIKDDIIVIFTSDNGG